MIPKWAILCIVLLIIVILLSMWLPALALAPAEGANTLRRVIIP